MKVVIADDHPLVGERLITSCILSKQGPRHRTEAALYENNLM